MFPKLSKVGFFDFFLSGRLLGVGIFNTGIVFSGLFGNDFDCLGDCFGGVDFDC